MIAIIQIRGILASNMIHRPLLEDDVDGDIEGDEEGDDDLENDGVYFDNEEVVSVCVHYASNVET